MKKKMIEKKEQIILIKMIIYRTTFWLSWVFWLSCVITEHWLNKYEKWYIFFLFVWQIYFNVFKEQFCERKKNQTLGNFIRMVGLRMSAKLNYLI